MSDNPVIFCQECRKPWGVRDGTDSDLRLAYAEWWDEQWNDAGLPVAPLPDLPATHAARIVYFSEANLEWLYDRGIEPEIGEPPCWADLDEHDCAVPAWWTTPRVKAAVRWEHGCCDLPDAWPLVHAAAVALAEKAEKDDATFGGRLVAAAPQPEPEQT